MCIQKTNTTENRKKVTAFLTKGDVDKIVSALVNKQDAIIIKLLFFSVQGTEVSEIRNLTIHDVDKAEREVVVTDDKNPDCPRSVKLDAETIALIEEAHQENEYVKKNGDMAQTKNVKTTVEMPGSDETEFVLKTGKTNRKHDKKVSQYTIYNRIEMIRDLEPVKRISSSLNSKMIVRSGMLYRATQILETEGGTLDNNKIKQVCKEFNVRSHWAVKGFMNIDTINSLYGEPEVNKG
ncbi:hypothetical protein [Alteribacter keqinensis]|uniref:MrpR C-terminal catalytic domain-containing protein n=1 Tax=Alteribacter keqinensis TaxID=2483800 RepID=A0A3M7TLF6_9BACI|nr:hypothetical protein [Alteribacter keqinensis]RNA66301.1 hypothetical protein EBO34_19475 [Alteribacter keqinensis]